MTSFDFKPDDKEGHETLDVISSADRFNRWMYETIQPHCTGSILEIGSGIGNISEFFIESGANITLSDIRENYCEILQIKFSGSQNLAGVHVINLTEPEFERKYAALLDRFDSVFALNVIEHIYDDKLAIANAHKLLKKGGKLVILVPAYQFLYNRFDKELEHYRRYTRRNLTEKLSEKFKVVHSQYFNAVGLLGWFLSGSILRKKTIPEGQMSLYNTLVPAIRIADKITFNTFGLSVIGVGEKQ